MGREVVRTCWVGRGPAPSPRGLGDGIFPSSAGARCLPCSALTPGQTRFPHLCLLGDSLSLDLPCRVVSPFTCQNSLCRLSRDGGISALPPGVLQPAGLLSSSGSACISSCAAVGFIWGRGVVSLFQPHFPPFQSFPAVVLNFCPLLLVDDGILAVQGCQKPPQIWPADSEAVCKTFLAIKKKKGEKHLLERMWRLWNPPTLLTERKVGQLL